MTETKLHLGCFDKPLAGWHNTDITPHLFIARIPGLAYIFYTLRKVSQERYLQHKAGIFKNVYYLNVTKKFPYADNTFEFAFTSHMLEHLYPWQGEFCLQEVYRVMKPGGIVRISVPDLDKTMASYQPENAEPFLKAFFEVEQSNPKNQHHWHYNENLLRALLEKIGFVNIQRCQFQQGRCADITLLDNRPASLFMEAEK